MNSLFVLLGLESWKPLITALVLPPVPWLILVLVGARLMLARRGLGWLVIISGVALLWLSACSGTAQLLSDFVLRPPPALSADRIKALQSAAGKPSRAIVILGGGLEPYAPEYGSNSLRYPSLERLRYGIWLSRETGLAMAFSGGTGWAQADSASEAQIAARIAAAEFGRPLKWVEDSSRDTRENAARSVALLRKSGVRHIVLVTHGSHMPRALRAFEQAASGEMRIEAAPMGLARNVDRAALAWIPSSTGNGDVRSALREVLGRWLGA